MKKWILGLCLAYAITNGSTKLFANPQNPSFFIQSVAYETLKIQNTSPDDYQGLSDSYSSRGENYLILGDDQKALEDFMLSYEYASNCKIKEDNMFFRASFGAFLAHVRLENLESVQELYFYLDSMLEKNCSQSKNASFYLSNDNSNEILFQKCRADQPIFGPDRIAIGECMDRVTMTVKAITYLITPVKKAEVRALATALINQLANSAYECCEEGGIWKACLQPLVNKLHYWKVLGIPADPMWD